MSWCPRLREDLLPLHAEDGTLEGLYDPVFERTAALGPISQRLVARLDGQTPVEAVLEAVCAAEPPVPREDAEHWLRSLLLLHLPEDSGPGHVERMRRLKQGEGASALVPLSGARFACQGSGACCQNYAFGPLGEDDLARLATLDVAGAYPELGPGPYVEEAELDGQRGWFLKTVDSRCVFLRDGLRCGLHAAFGPASKPALCQLYPLKWLQTVEGVKLFDVGECASFATSARAGPPLEESFAPLLHLIPERRGVYHPLVFLDERTPCDYSHFLELQRAACARLERPLGTPGESLEAVGALVRAFIDTVRACPLRPGEPEASLRALLSPEAPVPRVRLPEAPPREGLETLGALASALLGVLGPRLAEAAPPSEVSLARRMPREFVEVACVLQVLISHRVDPQAVALPEAFGEVLALPVERSEFDEVLRLSLRHQLFGDRCLLEDRPQPALLRMAFISLFTLVGARWRASQRRASRVEAVDLSAGHMLAQRLLRPGTRTPTFVEHAPGLWPALTAAAVLVDELTSPGR